MKRETKFHYAVIITRWVEINFPFMKFSHGFFNSLGTLFKIQKISTDFFIKTFKMD